MSIPQGDYIFRYDTKENAWYVLTSSAIPSDFPVGSTDGINAKVCGEKIFMRQTDTGKIGAGFNPEWQSDSRWYSGGHIKIKGPDGMWYFVSLFNPYAGHYYFDPRSGTWRYSGRSAGGQVKYAHTAQTVYYDFKRKEIQVHGFNAY